MAPSLAERIFGPKGPFGDFADRQRIERLESCAELQQAWQSCQETLLFLQRQEEAAVDQEDDSFEKKPEQKGRFWNLNLKRKSKNSSDSLNDPSESDSSPSPSVSNTRWEDTRMGMKIARYYNWGIDNPKAQRVIAQMRDEQTSAQLGTLTPNVSSNENDSESNHNSKKLISDNQIGKDKNHTLQNCNQESCDQACHAMWACRAIALGCASELSQLKSCFQQYQHQQKDSGNSLIPKPAYHHQQLPQKEQNQSMSSSSHTTPHTQCQLLQQELASCVLQQYKTLEERLN